MNLLVVDGDTLTLSVLCNVLALTGNRCLGLGTAQVVLDLLRKEIVFDAVIFDTMTLEIDSGDFAEKVKKIDSQLSLIAIANQGFLKEEAQLDGIVTKPVELDKLLEILRSCDNKMKNHLVMKESFDSTLNRLRKQYSSPTPIVHY